MMATKEKQKPKATIRPSSICLKERMVPRPLVHKNPLEVREAEAQALWTRTQRGTSKAAPNKGDDFVPYGSHYVVQRDECDDSGNRIPNGAMMSQGNAAMA